MTEQEIIKPKKDILKIFKRLFIGFVVVAVIAALIVVPPIVKNKNMVATYEHAQTLVESESYTEALTELEKIKEENYMDTHSLISLCEAHIEFTEGDVAGAYSAMKGIEFSYQTPEQMKRIEEFKGVLDVEYAKYEEEQERRAEEFRLLVEESNRKFYANLKTKIPYEGLSESDINKTIMGNYHEKDYDSKYKTTKYYWRTNDGEIMLIVTCKGNEATSVSRYGWGYFWTDDIKPIWNGKNPYKNKSSSSSKKSYHDGYDDGYEDVYNDGDYDWDRYDEDEDYAHGVDDALDDWDEYGEDW